MPVKAVKKQQASKKTPKLKVQKLSEKAIIPTQGYSGDAGFDLYAIEKTIINGNTVGKINTGIAIEIPKNYFGKIYDRSGFASKYGLSVKAGVIDANYRGEIMVIMANTSQYPVRIEPGDKFAQIVIHPLPEIGLEEVNKLSKSNRGDKGIGSTGI